MKRRITILLIVATVFALASGLFSCDKNKSELSDPEFQAPSLVATYGQTLSDLDLPEGFVWQDLESTSVGEIGEHTFLASYHPKDLAKYKIVSGVRILVTVQKRQTDVEAPDPILAVYGDTLQDLALPEGFSWQEDPSTSVGSVGDAVFYATYTPEDPAHNEIVRDLAVTVLVGKATYDLSGVVFDSKAVVYTGEPIFLSIRGTLPEGVTVSYQNNGQTEVGAYIVKAVFKGDEANYKAIEALTANLVITRGE